MNAVIIREDMLSGFYNMIELILMRVKNVSRFSEKVYVSCQSILWKDASGKNYGIIMQAPSTAAVPSTRSILCTNHS